MRTSLILGCLLLSIQASVAAQSDPEQPVELGSLDLAQLVEVKIIAATGSPQTVSQAPAVASVISAEQLAIMGVRYIDEALETVPGLHVTLSDAFLESEYSIRGYQDDRVLVLLDGVPFTQLLSGARSIAFRLPVANIERIEVIRGPGSAVYGADAVAGVINIVTRTATGTSGSEVGARAGSFDFQDGWFLHGSSWKSWKLGLSLEWQKSRGDHSRTLSRDTQTAFDELYGTHASLAPGPLQTRFEILDTYLSLRNDNWDLELWNWAANDHGVGSGSARALDPRGRQDVDQLLVGITYNTAERFEDWNFSTRLGYMSLDQLNRQYLLPPGAILPIGEDGNLNPDPEHSNPVLFTDGLIANPGDLEVTWSLETVSMFSGWAHHQVRLGAGLSFQDVNTRETLNFGPGVIDGSQPVVDGTLTDVTNTPYIYMFDQERDQWYLSFQDQWTLTANWELTSGVRYDRYSDFGGTLNPRLALVWHTSQALTTKFLFGSAFRRPSFSQQFFINNPVALGNPNLDPERSDTFEVALDFQPFSRLRTAFNFFLFEYKDQIAFLPTGDGPILMAQNARDSRGYGFEVEADWHVTSRLRLQSNVAWHRAEDLDTHQLLANTPRTQAFVALTQFLSSNWSIYGQARWIGDRARVAGDPRPQLEDYLITDLTLRRALPSKDWILAFGFRNLFDEEAREPSLDLLDDHRLEGRNVFVELRLRFDQSRRGGS